MELFESGEFKPVVDSTMPIEDIVDAHKRLESNVTTGKILLTVTHN